MEFEKNESTVSDEQRRLAETKKITLEPVHTNVMPDDIADSQVVAQHLVSPAIENAPNDRERSTKFVLPPSSKTMHAESTQESLRVSSPIKYIAGIVIFLCVGVTASILFMTKQ